MNNRARRFLYASDYFLHVSCNYPDRANKNEIGENLGAYRGEKGVDNVNTLRRDGNSTQYGLRTLRKRLA